MGLGRLTSEVAAELRRRLVRGEYGNGCLPSERTLQERLGASRMTLQTALAVLQAEGLIASVPKYGWQILPLAEHASFDTYSTLLATSPLADWPGLVAELLEHRATQVIGAVDAMMVSGKADTATAQLWFVDIRFITELKPWNTICEAEDRIFTSLMAAEGNRPRAFAAHQVRRALATVRALLNLSCYVEPQAARFQALFDAIETGDRNRAVALATETVTRRDPVYLRLVNQLVQHAGNRRESTGVDESANGLT